MSLRKQSLRGPGDEFSTCVHCRHTHHTLEHFIHVHSHRSVCFCVIYSSCVLKYNVHVRRASHSLLYRRRLELEGSLVCSGSREGI